MPLAKELALSAATTTPSLILTDTSPVVAALYWWRIRSYTFCADR